MKKNFKKMKTFRGLAVQRLVSTMKRISERLRGRSVFDETEEKEEDLLNNMFLSNN